ncbi:MAG: ABC transporter permease [Chloroflexi bacterium]|nr:ABC transporter permease [Chloroflexota bacterium]
MSRPSYRAWFVWQRDGDVFLRLWRSEAAGFLGEPLFVLAAMGFGLGAYIGQVNGQSYLSFIAPGIIAAYAMFGASFECTYGSFIRMEVQRTFEAIIATPLEVEDVIAGEILWGATRALLSAMALLVVLAVFGLVASPWAVLVPVAAVFTGFAFASISMVFTAIVPGINTFNYYFTLFITPMSFFSGVFFPLSGLPKVVQWLAWALPLTHGVNVVRAALRGAATWGLLVDVVWLGVVGAVAFWLALVLMRRRLIK